MRPMNGIEYRLYVPAEGARTFIDHASAIVGERRGDQTDVHFERGGADNVRTFEDRITHAAGRRSQQYPTVARGTYPAADLVDVGSVRYDSLMRRWVVSSIDDPDALEAWAPGPHEIGGSRALRDEAAGMIYGRLNSSGMTEVAMSSVGGRVTAEAIFAAAAKPGRLR